MVPFPAHADLWFTLLYSTYLLLHELLFPLGDVMAYLHQNNILYNLINSQDVCHFRCAFFAFSLAESSRCVRVH